MDILDEDKEKAPDDKVKEALDRYTEAVDAWQSNYAEALSDLNFYDGNNQWDEEAYKYLKGKNKTALVINRIPQFVHRVANQIRLNTPAIKVNPMDSGADIETAEVAQGIIRNIEYVSGADIAYDTAVTNAIKCGIGFFKIDHDYIAPDTFEQHILIKRINNPLSVIIDPLSIEADGSDAKYAFVIYQLTKKQFEKEYPEKQFVSFDAESYAKGETDGEMITLAEHYYIKEEELEIGQTADGQIVIIRENENAPIVSKRKIKKNKVYRCKLSGAEVLEESVFPAAYIPIIPVYGEEHYIDGKRVLYSLIRNAKEPQRMYNLAKSLEVELLKKAPKNQFIAAEGQIHGYEGMWKNPEAVETLIYKAADVKGTLLPQPTRTSPPPVPQGVLAISGAAVEEIKATMGIYDASLGNRSNETSGVAIQQRQQEGDLATAHFEDNLRRSIRHCGRIILDMIPRIYDTQRIIRVIGMEDEQEMVGLNGALAPEQERTIDLNIGKYDVEVTTGQSFSSKRQETAALMGDIMRGNPQLMGVMGDLMFKYMDVAGADAISARLKKTIPPQLLADDEDGQAVPNDPEKEQLAQQLEQAMQGLQAAQQQMQAMQADANNKQADVALKAKELEIKEAETMIKKQEADTKALEAQQDYQLEVARLQLEANKPVEQEPDAETPEREEISVKIEQDMQKEALEMEVKAAQTQAYIMAAMQIKGSVDALAASIQQPKQVVRDETGKIVGVQ